MFKIAETDVEKTLKIKIILLIFLTSATNTAAIIAEYPVAQILAYILAAITIFVAVTDSKIKSYFSLIDGMRTVPDNLKEIIWLHDRSCKMSIIVSLFCLIVLLIQ